MTQAVYRAVFTVLSSDPEILELLELSADNYEEEADFYKAKFSKILKYFQTEYIDMPRIIVMSSMYQTPSPTIPFIDRMFFRINVQTKDMSGRKTEKLLYRIRELIDGYTAPILDTDNVSYWSEFQWKKGSTIPVLHADIYELYHEYEISVAPKANRKIGM